MNHPEFNHPQLAILFQAALVCGSGANARSAVCQLTGQALFSPEKRSCIDGGTPLLLVVRSPGDRVFDVCVRHTDTLAGAQTWRRTRLDGFTRETWHTRLFPAAGRAATAEAHDMTWDCRVHEEFERLHASLGLNASPFLVARQHAHAADRVWIGWQLERHFHPSRALASCGRGDAWQRMAPVLESLLGRPAPLHSSGWCVLAGLGEGHTRIRVGTTQWSRVPESRNKIANLRKTVSSIGGDTCFAEALYRLLLPDGGHEGHFIRPVGCAVEIETFRDGSITTDFFLRIPCRAHASKLPTCAARSGAAA